MKFNRKIHIFNTQKSHDYEIKNDSAADDDDKNTEIKMTKPMVAQWENVEKILEIQKYQKTIL